MFASKLRDLKDLVEGSTTEHKAELLDVIKRLFSSKRNEITRSYFASSDREVSFIYRGNRSGAKPPTLTFSGPAFSRADACPGIH